MIRLDVSVLSSSQDPTVNRLEDSFLLWKAVVSNKLMSNVNIILFLNKCDLLQRKLATGVKLSRYMSGYGNRPNDYESVSRCTSLLSSRHTV
jgi:guanine nucleotide-binding protein alpha-1 subunit